MNHINNISKSNSNKIGFFIVIFCGMAWGLSGVLGQILFQKANLTPEYVSTFRMTLAGAVLTVFSIIRNGKSTFRILHAGRDTLLFLLFAMTGILALQFTYFAAIAASNAATATVIQYIYPVLILIYSAVIQKRTPRIYEIFAVVAVFSGVFIIATHCNVNQLTITPGALIWGILSAVSYGIYTVAPIRLYKEYGLVAVVGLGMLISGIVLGLCSGSFFENTTLKIGTIGIMLFITLIGSLLPMTLYGKGVAILGSVKASIFVTVEPIFSAILSVALGLNHFIWLDILGFALILIPIEYIVLRSEKNS